MIPRLSDNWSRARQSGAVAVYVAVFLVAMLTAVMLAVEVGRIYLAHRQLQKMASLAALDAVRQVSACDITEPPTQAAIEQEVDESLERNGDLADLEAAPVVETGRVRVDFATGRRSLEPLAAGAGLEDAQAVRVTLAAPFPALLTGFLSPASGRLEVSATAEQAALGSFFLGSGLASIEGGLANQLLGGLLCESGDTACQNDVIGLDLVDNAAGLAAANVSLGQLATAVGLDVEDLSDPLVLSTQTPVLSDVLDGLAGSLSGTVSSTVTTLLQDLADGVVNNNGQIPLGELIGSVDLRGANVPFINLLDLIVALGQAAQPSGPGVDPIALPVNLSVPGVADVSTFLRILEPPRFSGLGRPGQAEAHTAQVEVLVRIEAGSLLTGLQDAIFGLVNGLLGLISGVLGVVEVDVNVLPPPINLGIDISAAGASAYLDRVQCPRNSVNNGDPIAELSAESHVASVQVGTFAGSASAAPALNTAQTTWPVVTVDIDATCGLKLLGSCTGLPNLGQTTVSFDLALSAVGVSDTARQPLPLDVVDFTQLANLPEGTAPVWLADQPVPANPQTVGSSTSAELNLSLESNQSGGGLTGLLIGLVSDVVNGVTALVQPLLELVNNLANDLIDPLLSLLGIQTGTASVTMNTVTIDQPRIVSTALPPAVLPPAP